MAGITNGLQSLTLGARPVALSSRAACRAQPVVSRGPSVGVAAGRGLMLTVEAKQNSRKRVRQAAKARMYNKSTKSEVATRIKKVMQSVADAQAAGNAGSAAMAVLLSEAYKCIDQAAAKGILKKNTAARRKSLVGRAVGSVATAAA